MCQVNLLTDLPVHPTAVQQQYHIYQFTLWRSVCICHILIKVHYLLSFSCTLVQINLWINICLQFGAGPVFTACWLNTLRLDY